MSLLKVSEEVAGAFIVIQAKGVYYEALLIKDYGLLSAVDWTHL